MHYVYILQSLKDNNLYIGFTSSLEKRIREHNNGEVQSTKPRRPLKLIFYEAYLNQNDALRREDYFKSTKGKRTIKIMLKEYLNPSEFAAFIPKIFPQAFSLNPCFCPFSNNLLTIT